MVDPKDNKFSNQRGAGSSIGGESASSSIADSSSNARHQQEQQQEQQQQHDNDEHSIILTPSADSILDVTPVNSFAMDSARQSEENERLRQQQAQGFLDTSHAGSLAADTEVDDEDDGVDSMQRFAREKERNKTHGDENEDQDNEETEEQEDGDDDDDRASSSVTHSDVTTEWDKALLKGKSNKGDASDFFATPSRQSTMVDEETTSVAIEAIETSLTTTAEGGAATATIEEVSTTTPREDKNDRGSASTRATKPSRQTSYNPLPLPPSTGLGGANSSISSAAIGSLVPSSSTTLQQQHHQHHNSDHLNSGVLPDVLMTMRLKLESLTMFDSDMMRLAATPDDNDPLSNESRESLKRSSQQSISAAVLVSLAHKRYERRRLAAMEIEKVVRSLVQQGEMERIRAILLLLSDDYVRSTSEDARKGGVVALAACAIGMKKVKDDQTAGSASLGESQRSLVQECRDLILASVVHACQDHSQRVRYYACENLCNTVKVIPILAIQHFFILFEILRSLYADVSVDVRKGAEILDRKIKDIVVAALNSGALKAEACIPVFARFVYSRNKPTKRLTLTWLQEWSEKLIGSPILEYLHLFLGGIFDMIGDPAVAIRQSALAFLQSVLPKLLTLDYMDDTPIEEGGPGVVNFDKILQALVTTMEHPNPFVRKVAMYWMSRIVKAHIGDTTGDTAASAPNGESDSPPVSAPRNRLAGKPTRSSSAASVSVRNSFPHVLPGILLSIGDTYDPSGGGGGANSSNPSHHHHNIKNSFLPDQTTRELAEKTNASLQEAVRKDGASFVQHLDGFIIALREELDSPGGLLGKNAPAIERTPYRMDVNHDGSGIESPGWFRGNYNNNSGAETAKERVGNNDDSSNNNNSTMVTQSRLCALHWVIVLYQYVVPDLLKADYAREFIYAIINQLVDDPPKRIVYKSLEVLAKITVPVSGEDSLTASAKKFANPSWVAAPPHRMQDWSTEDDDSVSPLPFYMTQTSLDYALDILGHEGRQLISRNREVFSALIEMHSNNPELVADLPSVISFMCKLQPSEFVMVSFAVELDRFVRKRQINGMNGLTLDDDEAARRSMEYAQDLKFVSSFVQHMNHVLLNSEETQSVREILKDCCMEASSPSVSERDRRRVRIFHILLHSWSHNLGAVLSLCLWSGAFCTAALFLQNMNPLDVNLVFLLEIDRLVELLERPLFRHLNIRMLEHDSHPHHSHQLHHHHPLDQSMNEDNSEGSGTMLFRALKSLLMILPQSTAYRVLAARLNSIARFRQSTNLSLVAAAAKQQQQPHRPRTNRSPSSTASPNSKTELYANRVLQIRDMHCQAAWTAIRADSLETPSVTSESGANYRHNNINKARNWYHSNDDDEDRFSIHKKPLPFVRDVEPKEEERWKLYWTTTAAANSGIIAATAAAAASE